MFKCCCGLLIIVISGCTNEQIYQSVQQNRQQECQKLDMPLYDECMNEYEQSYQEYQREREEVLKE